MQTADDDAISHPYRRCTHYEICSVTSRRSAIVTYTEKAYILLSMRTKNSLVWLVTSTYLSVCEGRGPNAAEQDSWDELDLNAIRVVCTVLPPSLTTFLLTVEMGRIQNNTQYSARNMKSKRQCIRRLETHETTIIVHFCQACLVHLFIQNSF